MRRLCPSSINYNSKRLGTKCTNVDYYYNNDDAEPVNRARAVRVVFTVSAEFASRLLYYAFYTIKNYYKGQGFETCSFVDNYIRRVRRPTARRARNEDRCWCMRGRRLPLFGYENSGISGDFEKRGVVDGPFLCIHDRAKKINQGTDKKIKLYRPTNDRRLFTLNRERNWSRQYRTKYTSKIIYGLSLRRRGRVTM